jgi:site-specific DNA recombinase
VSSRAATYSRQSHTKIGSESLERQVESCRDAADRAGVEIVTELVEPASTSGYANRGRNRPRFRELINLVDRGEVDCVVVYMVDRLGRGGGIGFAPLFEVAERRGLDLNHFVLTADGGWVQEVMLGIRASLDREESRKLSDRMLAIRQREAEQGKPRRGSRRPFGYEADGVTVNEDEAELIRDAAKRAIAGESLRSICQSWNDAGIKSSTGSQWSISVLSGILRSPRIRGQRAHHGQVVGPAQWLALIDDELAAQLDDALAPRRAGGMPRTYLLSGGLLRCGECGTPMRSHARAGGGRTYWCPKGPSLPGCGKISIAADGIEDFARTVVTLLYGDPKINSSIQAHAVSLTTSDVAAIKMDLDAKRERIEDLAADGIISKKSAKERLQRLTAERQTLSRQSGAKTRLTIPTDPEQLSKWWDRASVTSRAELFGLVFDHIVVRRSTRPRGSRGFESNRLLLVENDFVAGVIEAPALKALTADNS